MKAKKSAWLLRVLVLLLCVSMLTVTLASCGDDEEKEANTTAPTREQQQGSTVDEDGYLKDDLDGVNFGGTYGMNLLGCKRYAEQFKGDETATAPVARAIFERETTVEDRLGIIIEWNTEHQSEWANRSEFINEVERAFKAGESYDACIAYNMTPHALAYRGFCENLYDTEYIDLSKPWWPAEYSKQMVLNDRVYALTESCDFGVLRNLMCFFFNNDYVESYKLESPYDLVEENRWTIATVKEQIKGIYDDKDNNGKKSGGDFYGLCTATKAKLDAWFFAFGNRFSEKTPDGELISKFDDPYIQYFVDDMIDLLNLESVYSYDVEQYQMFKEERVIYYASIVQTTEILVAENISINYGVVPMPKWDEYQDRYYTHLSNTYDTWCVMKGCKDLNVSSALLEAMASGSYRTIDPVYFETNVKSRYAPDERLGSMYDLIRDSVVFDFVYLYKIAFVDSGVEASTLVKNCYLKKEGWSSTLRNNSNVLNTNFGKIKNTFFE